MTLHMQANVASLCYRLPIWTPLGNAPHSISNFRARSSFHWLALDYQKQWPRDQPVAFDVSYALFLSHFLELLCFNVLGPVVQYILYYVSHITQTHITLENTVSAMFTLFSLGKRGERYEDWLPRQWEMPERSVLCLQPSPGALSVMPTDHTSKPGAVLFPLSSVGTGFPPNKTIRMQERWAGITGRKILISFI